MSDNSPLHKKWLWFVGLWLAGFLTLTIVGYGIKLVMGL